MTQALIAPALETVPAELLTGGVFAFPEGPVIITHEPDEREQGYLPAKMGNERTPVISYDKVWYFDTDKADQG